MSDPADDKFEQYARKHGISRDDAVDLACRIHAAKMANAQMKRFVGIATRRFNPDLVAAAIGARGVPKA